MLPLNHTQIEAIRTEKRDLEVAAAKTLNRYYNQHYKYRIQRLVRQMLNQILSARNPKAVNQMLAKKRGQFLMFQRGVDPSFHGLEQFLKREMFWSLENCSDMIRLFGEMHEQASGNHPAPWETYGLSSEHEEGLDKLRPEPTFVKYPRDKDGNPIKGKPVKEGGWGEFGHRDRGNRQPTPTGAPYANIGNITRGVDKFKFLEHSVVSAIDHTFGLKAQGADVSGTTTDSIYSMRWAGGAAGLTPDLIQAVQLLPMVTMVPQGHHTMVECAYPLSRHRIIDYHIGYYKTLAPTYSPGLFDNVLGALDGSKENKRVLIWGRGAGEQGVWMDKADEIAAFKKAARVLSAYGFCVAGGLRNFEQAMNVMRTFSPNLLAPRLQAMREQVGLSDLEKTFQRVRGRPFG